MIPPFQPVSRHWVKCKWNSALPGRELGIPQGKAPIYRALPLNEVQYLPPLMSYVPSDSISLPFREVGAVKPILQLGN